MTSLALHTGHDSFAVPQLTLIRLFTVFVGKLMWFLQPLCDLMYFS